MSRPKKTIYTESTLQDCHTQSSGIKSTFCGQGAILEFLSDPAGQKHNTVVATVDGHDDPRRAQNQRRKLPAFAPPPPPLVPAAGPSVKDHIFIIRRRSAPISAIQSYGKLRIKRQRPYRSN